MTDDLDRTPTVTMVVQCYNHERFVARAIEAAFAQTYPNLFVLVVDDASTDGSADVIRAALERSDRPSRFVHHVVNRGQCPTLNEILAQIDTPYVAITSGDDWSEPERIAACVEVLHPLDETWAAVYTDVFHGDEDGNQAPETANHGNDMPEGDLLPTLVEWNVISAPGILMRTAALREAGGYDEALPVEDYDLWLRLAARFRIAYLDRPLSTHRLVSGSLFDRVGPEYFRRSRLHSLRKHLGLRPDTDELILDRLWKNATWLYLRGDDPRDLVDTFAVIARRRMSRRTVLWYLLSAVRVPGPWIGRALGLVGRRGTLHADPGRWTDAEMSSSEGFACSARSSTT